MIIKTGVFCLDRVRKQIHYEYIEKLGLTGKGVNVCVLDTGISSHIDFDHRIIEFVDLTKNPTYKIRDDSGHGTHVCGILAGSGKASGGLYKGIAIRSNLIVLKVLNHQGNGQVDTLLSALQWVLEHCSEYSIRIVNISISVSKNCSLHTDRIKLFHLKDLLYRLHEKNILIVTAAGNEGPDNNSISILGNQNYTLCVGCHDGDYKSKSDTLCEQYSGRGYAYYSMMKPDVVAPGTEIVSCSGKNRRGYTSKSGTSMSCPIISGVAADLMELLGNVAIDTIANKIRMGTTSVNTPRNQQGYGMIDCKKIFEKYTLT